VEILSKLLLDYSRKNLETQSMCGFIKGSPEAIQMVEFYGDTEADVLSRPREMIAALQQDGYGYAYDVYPEGEIYRNVWSIRERGLGLLLGEPTEKKGVEFIEDAAIPIEHLADYIDEVLQICARYDVDVTYYAHASVGVIHVRPVLNLRLAEDIQNLKNIAAEVFKLVVHYKGSWSSEHGDGLIRSGFLKEFYGDTIYGLFEEVKRLFDPAGLLNPGKIVAPPPMDQNLRYGTTYHDQPVDTLYHYRDQIDFHTAVHQCSGIGACRKMSGGTMCPSYMVTREETHTTRGRANALRLAMSGQLSGQGLSDPALKETLDLCVSCKACKAECPSSVDMARLKSEVLQMQYHTQGISFRDRLICNSATMAKRLCGPLAPMVNTIQSSAVGRYMIEKTAGLTRHRALPGYASESFEVWFKKHYKPHDGPQVVLFADTYLNFHEPEIGKAAVRLINFLGFDITLASGCCQRPRISHGFLELAKEKGTDVALTLDHYLQNAVPVLVCEPSCVSAFTDDLPDLIDDKSLGDRMHSGIIPIEKWVEEQIREQNITSLRMRSDSILLHGHCHQKALFGTRPIHQILQSCGADVTEPDSGCCGMAGSFGYEVEHVRISEKMLGRVLGPAVDQLPRATVVASGFSCRHQIAHFTGRKAIHWLETINIPDRT
jgi:Fe-S oxidoreductase